MALSSSFILSSSLRQDCREKLGRCNKFNSHKELSTFFALSKELYTYRDSLSEADNKAARIDDTMKFLLDLDTSQGELVFLIFLRELRDSVPNAGGLYRDLSECCDF